jgi:mannose-6-phosphate isomerase-like protein (cupin superfamily)
MAGPDRKAAEGPRPPRRVIAARGPDGAGEVAADGTPPLLFESDRYRTWVLFGSEAIPPTGEHGEPFAATFMPPPGGVRVTVADVFPGERSQISAGMHDTPTIDFVFVLAGTVHLIESGGAEVVLEPGDSVVQVASGHSWHNPGPEPARIGVVLLGTGPRA